MKLCNGIFVHVFLLKLRQDEQIIGEGWLIRQIETLLKIISNNLKWAK